MVDDLITIRGTVGRRSIVDKASAYGAKGPLHSPVEATIYKMFVLFI